MNQIRQEKNSLKLVWNGKPEKITLTPSVLEIKEFISYKSSNLNQLKKINPDYWSNLLIKGNNLNTISSLLEAPFRKMIQKSGGIKLAYIDPPFFTGQDRFLNKSISKNPNINSNEKIAYKDKWNNSIETYLSTLYKQIFLINKILKTGGYLYVHVDYRTSSPIKLILDEIFGHENLIGYIIWVLNYIFIITHHLCMQIIYAWINI